jgi:hypothetical protein
MAELGHGDRNLGLVVPGCCEMCEISFQAAYSWLCSQSKINISSERAYEVTVIQ